MQKEFFEGVPRISYEGPESKNPLSFRHYNSDEKVGDKTMREHLRFAVCYWHTFKSEGSDPFGVGTLVRPWLSASDPIEQAKDTLKAAFELFTKLGVPFYCFHDRDIAPEADTLEETNRQLDVIVDLAEKMQEDTGVKLLWGTANLFTHPRYMHGAATSCDPNVFAHAAAQVKKAMEVTHRLGGQGYVFWGGREGYETLLNTNMKQEMDQLARFLQMAVDYKRELGFTGQLLIEPKPKEPTVHQYDFDASNVIAFLKTYGLDKDFKLNIEANHATLAGHAFEHELALASAHRMLGSIDANRGHLLLGWDTDQFPTDVYQTTLAMLVVLKQGGIAPGGFNFDAKVRRGSTSPVDLFHAHIGAMDAFALGLKVAHRIIENGVLEKTIEERYKGWEDDLGRRILSGQEDFKSLQTLALSQPCPLPESGGQEALENLINRYLFSG